MADKGKFAQWNILVGERQPDVLDLFDPTDALPVDPTTGDRYIATATANGWTINRTYTWSGAAWVGVVPVLNMQAAVADKNAEYLYNGVTWVVISVPVKVGRNAYLGDTPPARAAEWGADEPRRHTIRRGRAAWARPRPEEEPGSSSLVSLSSESVSLSISSLSSVSLSISSLSSVSLSDSMSLSISSLSSVSLSISSSSSLSGQSSSSSSFMSSSSSA